MRYNIDHPEFNQCVDTTQLPQVIASGLTWTEGPVWWHNALYFNDIPSKRMFRWNEKDGLSVAVEDSDFANGNTLDAIGRMISCEHGGRRVIARTDPSNPQIIEVLATHFDGKRLNSPNDVVVKRDGTIWFTDPPYGINSDIEGYPAESEIGSNNVYRLDPNGALICLVSDFDKPNGLAFSPDESKLYVADSGAIQGASFPGIDYSRPHHIRVFDVSDNTVASGGVFAVIEPGVPDGLRVDVEGRVWTSAADGIYCIRPDGTQIGHIQLPDATANCCFGGEDGSTLFITSSGTVYQVRTNTTGAGLS